MYLNLFCLFSGLGLHGFEAKNRGCQSLGFHDTDVEFVVLACFGFLASVLSLGVVEAVGLRV